jgi:hypothetical protein
LAQGLILTLSAAKLDMGKHLPFVFYAFVFSLFRLMRFQIFLLLSLYCSYHFYRLLATEQRKLSAFLPYFNICFKGQKNPPQQGKALPRRVPFGDFQRHAKVSSRSLISSC